MTSSSCTVSDVFWEILHGPTQEHLVRRQPNRQVHVEANR
jgi:hypothetical protein